MKMAKRYLSMLLTLCMVLGLLPGTALASNSNKSFLDVSKSAWYYDAVQYVFEKGMMSGTGEESFSPEGATTRGMIVTILHNLAGRPSVAGKTFTDVSADQYYANAVSWASAKGIVSGYGDGRFGPNDVITREQLAVILYGYARDKGYDLTSGKDVDLRSYQDFDQLAAWAVTAMQWACGEGLISGMGNNTLAPKGNATRAQAAAVFKNLHVNVVEKVEEKTETPVDPGKTNQITGQGGVSSSNGGSSSGSRPSAPSKPSEPSQPVGLTGAVIMRNGVDVTGKPVSADDVLSISVAPAGASYSVEWKIGAKKVLGTTYAVQALDAGQTITATVTGTGSYTGTINAAATGKITVTVDLNAGTDTKAPVAIEKSVKFVDADGNNIEIAADAKLEYKVETTIVSEEQLKEEVVKDLVTSITQIGGVCDEDAKDIKVNYVAIDADLFLKAENGSDTAVHPVGKTVVTLSKENLGIDAAEDISNYVIFANHTNKDDETENVEGKVKTIDGVQYVSFELNGLSRIYIGNVPPLTVTFDTDGGSEIPAQKVKLGGYAKDVEPPVKEGWLFVGWDHDIQTENIIKDITVTARWIKGTTAEDDQLWGQWLYNGQAVEIPENVKETVANGTVTLTLDSEEKYPCDMSYILSIKPVKGATQMAVASTAEAALLADTVYCLAPDTSVIAPDVIGNSNNPYALAKDTQIINVMVTDDEGNIETSNTNRYIKWVAEDGTVLGLQSARLVVRTDKETLGNYDTQTRVETIDVNRGLGQIEFYMTNGKDNQGNVIPDYVGAINGYLNGSVKKGYYLDVYASFYQDFWHQGEYLSGKNYSGIKLVIKPFEGESFNAVPHVNAYVDAQEESESGDYTNSVTAKLENGNIVLTCPNPAFKSEYAYLELDLELNGISQSLSVDFDNYSNDPDDDNKATTFDSEKWAEILNAVADGIENIYYTGAENVTLNTALTLKPGQRLSFENDGVSLTIGKNGVLTLEGNDVNGSMLYVWDGKLTVKDGGILATNSQDSTQKQYYNNSVRAEYGIVIDDGGTVSVPAFGYFRIDGNKGGLTVEQDGKIENNGRLNVMHKDGVGSLIAGTVTSSGTGYLEFNDGLTVASTGSITTSEKSRFENYGKLVVEQGGQLNLGGRYADMSGRVENYGSINITNGYLTVENTGYSVYNGGTISVVEDCELEIHGTVLVNTGTINGSGILFVGELDDISEYDNGIEYVEVNEYIPSDYSRYQFVRDPRETVDLIYFEGELSNQGGGTCTLKVKK